jgi:LacI family transcriptional regulator
MGVTLKQIAKQAKVSVATVSMALNNKQGVGQKKRQSILRIAKELGYGRKAAGRGLRTAKGTMRFIKVIKSSHVLNRDHDIFIADYINGLDHAARRTGYNLEISSCQQSAVEELLDSLRHSDLKGAVVLGTELNHRDLQVFERCGFPVVVLDTYYDYLDLDFVDMNNIDAVYSIVSHLQQKGHREIGMVRSSVATKNFQLREQGFQAALAHFGLSCRREHLFSVDSTCDGAYEDMRRILAGGARLPQALFLSNDIVAFGCVRAFKEAGLRVPQDVSVIGFDDLPAGSIMEPPLSSYAVSKMKMGEMALRILVERIEQDPHMPPMKITISGQLVSRASVRQL